MARALGGRRWQLSDVRAWGSWLCEPGGAIYVVRRVTTHGDRLDLWLSDANRPEVDGDALCLSAPRGLSVSATGFRIQSAAFVEWGVVRLGPPPRGDAPALDAE